jgi:two-component system sensor histidine kinase CreC
MDRRLRIALADLADGLLADRVRALPMQPDVSVHAALFAAMPTIALDPPDVLLLSAERDAAELPGVLRMLRALLPHLGIIVVAPLAQEIALLPLCTRNQAQWLPLPCNDGALAAALERALHASNRPLEGLFLDLAHGFADAVNSPLQSVTGHLQLLQLQLDPAADQARRQLVGNVLTYAQRIQAIVDEVHLAARAAEGARTQSPVDLRAVLGEALTTHTSKLALPVTIEPDGEQFVVLGDSTLLQPAVAGLVRLAHEIQAVHGPVRIALSRFRSAVRLRLVIDPPGLPQWRLPRTFEPYYLNRLLRGSAQGLALFVCQAVTHGHGGQATARRLPDDSLAIDLLLPAS